MKRKSIVTIVGVVISLAVLVFFTHQLLLAAGVHQLTSVKAAAEPKLDGDGGDAVWNDAPELQVQAKDGPMITLKSVHTADKVFLLVSWEDETESVNKSQWVYDGAEWGAKQELRLFEDEPRKADEDRLGMKWSINDSVAEFQEKGCKVACHDSGRYAKDEARMFTNAPTEFIDSWHWKAARSNPIGYADDKWLDSTVLTKEQEPDLHDRIEGARHGDDKGPGKLNYSDNKEEGKPKFIHKDGPGASYFLTQETAVAIADSKVSFKEGDTTPGYVLARPKGSRGDVDAAGVHKDGRWTLELGRTLATEDKEHDVQFDDLTKTYYFGMSVFDNDGGGVHMRPEEPLSLSFK